MAEVECLAAHAAALGVAFEPAALREIADPAALA